MYKRLLICIDRRSTYIDVFIHFTWLRENEGGRIAFTSDISNDDAINYERKKKLT